jgi:two-component sensor histidine kinase
MSPPTAVKHDFDTAHDVMIAELRHRIRNLLTIVQWLINRTNAVTVDEYRTALIARIGNLLNAQMQFEAPPRRAVFFSELLIETLNPVAAVAPDRVCVSGPEVPLGPRVGLALRMVLHELATNATKHGALASSSGWVNICWDQHTDGGTQRLLIQWRELGGPEVSEPKCEGFGLRLAAAMLPEGQFEIRFERTGVVCRIEVELHSFDPRATMSHPGRRTCHDNSISDEIR